MELHTFGSKNGKKIILIHGMLTPRQIWQKAIEAFSKDHYVIVPELDGHTQGRPSRFESVQREAEQIREFLLKDGTEVYALCGLSMGGRIAAELAGMSDVNVKNLILDGAPLLPMPKFMIGIMRRNYISLINRSKQRDPKVMESFKKSFMPEAFLEDYLKLADNMDEESIKNMVESVFSAYEFRKFDDPCRILFMHGTKGNEVVSKKAALKMKDCNPQTEIRCFKGYAHAQMACFEAEKWISEVKDFLK